MENELVLPGTKKLIKYFTIAKVALCLPPFVAYFYLTLQSTLSGEGLATLIADQPQLIILFILAMISPYVAFLVGIIEKEIAADEFTGAIINMSLLIIGLLITVNVFYISVLVFVFYHALRYYQLDFIAEMKKIRIRNILIQGGGSLMVVFVNIICLIATFRLI